MEAWRSTTTPSAKCSAMAALMPPLRYIGGLIGYNPGIINHGLWDTETSGQQVGIGIEIGNGRSSDTLGRTTAELQSPMGYTGPYRGWNLSLYTPRSRENPGITVSPTFGTSAHPVSIRL